MTSISVMRRDHYDADNDGTVDASPLSDEDPHALGTASAGTGSAAARSDHVHAMPDRARGAYDAVVYIEGAEVVAEDSQGRKIASGVSGTDDATVIQAAVTASDAQDTIEFVGHFAPASSLTIEKPLNLIGRNASFFWDAPNTDEMLTCAGKINTTVVLTANAVAGDLTIEVGIAQIPEILPGDLVILYDNTVWTSDYPGWLTGEIHEVRAFDACTGIIILCDQLLRSHTTANGASIKIITPWSGAIDNIQAYSNSQTADRRLIKFDMTSRSKISNCNFWNAGGHCIYVHDSYECDISDNNIRNAREASTGYGISVGNASAYINVHNNIISGCRHCVTHGGATGIGQVRLSLVRDNVIISGGIASAIDAHSIVESIVVDGNSITGVSGFAAMITGAKLSIFRNNNIWNGAGIAIRADNPTGMNVFSKTNTYHNCSSGFNDNNAGASASIDFVSMVGDEFLDGVDTLYSADSVSEFSIKSCKIDNATAYRGIYAKGAIRGAISNTTIRNTYRAGISLLECSNIDVLNTVIENPNRHGGSSNGYFEGIYLSDATQCNIRGCVIRDTTIPHLMKYGIREYGTSDSNIFDGNYISGHLISPVTLIGPNSHVRRGTGAESSGSSTGTGSEQTIAHGLVSTPSKVAIVPTETGATVSSVWADATNIYATVTTCKAYNWSADV